MVLLQFKIIIKANIKTVWDYFSRFENIQEWDPNVRTSKIGIEKPGRVGTTYDLVTVFKGNESDITYTLLEYDPCRRLVVRGKTSMITASDDITFKEVGEGEATEIHYSSEISLNHVLSIFNMFIRKDLEQLAVSTEEGMRKRSRELFGLNVC